MIKNKKGEIMNVLKILLLSVFILDLSFANEYKVLEEILDRQEQNSKPTVIDNINYNYEQIVLSNYNAKKMINEDKFKRKNIDKLVVLKQIKDLEKETRRLAQLQNKEVWVQKIANNKKLIKKYKRMLDEKK